MVAAAILALATASMHYLSFAVVAITLGLEACYGLTQRAFGRSLAYLAIALLCAIVIAPSLMAYFRLGAVRQATAAQGVNGLVVVGRALLLALSSNVLVLALAGYRRYAGRRNLPIADMWLRDAALMAIACGGAIIASFLLLNAFKPFLTPRYLLQLSPLVCMVAASLAARCADRATMAVIGVNVLAAALAAVILQGFNRRWEYHIGVIRAEMAACRSTRLFAIDPFELGQASPPPRAGESPLQTMRAITESGYREIAARRGVALAGYLPWHPARRDIADVQVTGACPIILWLESNYWRPDIGAVELAQRMGLPAAIWARYAPDVRRSGDHLLVILRARSHSPSPAR